MSAYELLRMERDGAVAIVTIDRPEKRNALNAQVRAELIAVLDALRDDDSVRVLVITGAGDKAFVAGADIGEFAQRTPLEQRAAMTGRRVFDEVAAYPKPVLAMINGLALGGGCELALACHLRVAGENAQFGLPEVKLGIIPGYGGTLRLPRIVGKGRALELMLTAQFVRADEAYRIGLVHKVVPRPQAAEGGEAPSPKAALIAETRALMTTILANGPIAVGLAIECSTRGMEMSVDDGLAMESNLFGLLAATTDMREGMQAFLDKRKAEFTGR